MTETDTQITVQNEQMQTRSVQPPKESTAAATVTVNTNSTIHSQQRTTTTTSSDSTPLWRQLDSKYFFSIPGILKIIQLIFGIICIACASPPYGAHAEYFMVISVFAFVVTFLWCIIYLFRIREQLDLPVDWIIIEIGLTALITLFYLIAFCVLLAYVGALDEQSGINAGPASRNFRAAYMTAGVFGVFNTLAYAAGIFFLYKTYRSARLN